MSDLRIAAQQALEALQWHYRQGHSNTLGGFRLKIDEKALRELSAALAQQAEPAQEPAFHGFMSDDGTQVDVCFSPSAPRIDGTYATAYYTAPPKLVPLTEEEIMHIGMTHQSLRQVVRAVERAHGIKE